MKKRIIKPWLLVTVIFPLLILFLALISETIFIWFGYIWIGSIIIYGLGLIASGLAIDIKNEKYTRLNTSLKCILNLFGTMSIGGVFSFLYIFIYAALELPGSR